MSDEEVIEVTVDISELKKLKVHKLRCVQSTSTFVLTLVLAYEDLFLTPLILCNGTQAHARLILLHNTYTSNLLYPYLQLHIVLYYNLCVVSGS